MSGQPFMSTVEMTDDMLIDIGGEVITWGEFQRRDRDGSPKGGNGVAGAVHDGPAGTASPNLQRTQDQVNG